MSPSEPRPAPGAGGTVEGDGSKLVALLVIASLQLMVVLDITIVNIALPQIQSALDFTTANLSWVINAYTLTFGGLLLLGGRSGDILGRRRMFVFGVSLFTLASLLCGVSQAPWQLLAARALQGLGGAVASPTALALIATIFEEGRERNRAFAVFAGVSAGGGAIGLLAGGVLVEWLTWRWIFFVNVPIGVLIVLATARYIQESERRPGRFDVLGAFTSTLGMVALVYGFIHAGEKSWSDPLTVTAFTVAVVLLGAFFLVERTSRQPITPLELFRDRNRSGTYAIMLCLAAAMFGMFFFLTLFVQDVMGFSPLEAGLAFLPVSAVIAVSAAVASQLLPRTGPKIVMVSGAVLAAAGLAWLARLEVTSSYAGGILGPMLVFGFGMGFEFVSLTLMAVSNVAERESGAASGVLNVTQQVGGSLGLSILVTVFSTGSRNKAEDLVRTFLARATPEERRRFQRTGALPRELREQVLAAGITSAFIAAALMAALAALVAVLMIQTRAADLERFQGRAPSP